MQKPTTSNASRPTVLEVRLADRLVGTLTNLPNDQNLFAFDPAYIADPNRPVLSLSFYDAFRALITNIRPVTRRFRAFVTSIRKGREAIILGYFLVPGYLLHFLFLFMSRSLFAGRRPPPSLQPPTEQALPLPTSAGPVPAPQRPAPRSSG